MLSLLQKLTAIPAVAGDESPMEQFLMNFAQQYQLPYIHEPGYGVVIGNPKAPIYAMAHIDEVGGKITKTNPHIRFEGIGWVTPGMFVGREIEIIAPGFDPIPGIILGKKALKTNYTRFADLEIYMDPIDLSKIKSGMTLRYRQVFEKRDKSLFATSLDNRIGVMQLLQYIKKNKEKHNLFDQMAFCFATEEEIKNKGALSFVTTYIPKICVICDMIPQTLAYGSSMKFPMVQWKTPDYTLDPYFHSFLPGKEYEMLAGNRKIFTNSESKKYQDACGCKAIECMTPIYNYHHGVYFVEDDVLQKCTQFVFDICDDLLL